MAEQHGKCSVCERSFEVEFSYQAERHVAADGTPELRLFCSQRCLGASHTSTSAVRCDACARSFSVTRPAEVLYQGARRHYCCSAECRAHLQRDSRGRSTEPRASHAAGAEATVAVAQRPIPNAAEAPSARGERTSNAPRVFSVFNHKGGTGKTTTAVTVAAGLATRGLRTLLVDTDGQGNVAVSLGLEKPARSLYHVLVMGVPPAEAIVSARENLDVLCANETLAAAELYLAGRQNRDRMLSARLASARDAYDAIVVDCSPSLSLLNQNALVFSDAVLCPVACDYLSLIGVRQVVKTIKNVNRLLGHPVQLWGVLPTMYDRRARICNEALETLQEHFGERCLPPIRAAIRAKEAPSQGKTLFEYGADSQVTDDYTRVVDRIISAARPQSASLVA